jgi:hypothetical protein
MISIPITTTTKTVKVRITPRDGEWLGNTPAVALGTASAGTSGMAAREDHAHPMPGAADVGADPAGSAAAAQAYAVQRSNHSGTQLAATISDFNAAAGAAAPVQSVAGKTGAVALSPGDVGADPAGTAATAAAAAQAHAVQRTNHTGTQIASTISDFNAAAGAAAPVQSVAGKTGAVALSPGDVGADAAGSAAAAQAAAVQRANHTGTQPISSIVGLQEAIDNFAALLASDTADLDTLQEIVDFIRVNREDLDSLTISSIAGLQAALNASVQRGNHTGTQLAATISDFNAAAGAAAPVQSVAGKTGAVTLSPGDVGADPAGTAATAAAAAQAHAVQRTNHSGTQLAATISDFNAAAGAAAPVQSVAGKTGAVTLSPGDVGADPAGTAATAAAAVQAYAVQRTNHTGTQSADTLTDGTTNKAFTATEKTKLAGISTGATVTNAATVGAAMTGAAAKTTPVDADTLPINDSGAGNALKKVTFANLKVWVTGVINTWWGSLTTAVKTTGDQEKSGTLTVTSPIVSTGTPTQGNHLLNRDQADRRRLRATRPLDRWMLRERLEYFVRGSTASGDIGEWGWTSSVGAGGSISYGGAGAFATGRTVQLSTGATINTTVEVRKAIGSTMERASILSMFLDMAPVAGGTTSPITDAAVWFGWDDGGALGRHVMAGWDTAVHGNFQIKVRGSYDAEETVIDTEVPLASMVPPYWPVSIVLDVVGSFINNQVLGNAEAHRISLFTSVDWIEILERYTATVPASQIDGTNIFCRITNRAATNKVIRLTGVEVLHGSGNPSGQH